jgi:hypothetical protein
MRERDWALKIAAFTPPPWRQRRRGNDRESGIVSGTLDVEMGIMTRANVFPGRLFTVVSVFQAVWNSE